MSSVWRAIMPATTGGCRNDKSKPIASAHRRASKRLVDKQGRAVLSGNTEGNLRLVLSSMRLLVCQPTKIS